MNLQIRDPRAHELAQRLAKQRGVSLTDAVIEALKADLERRTINVPLAERLRGLADQSTALAKPGGRDRTQNETDAMWGHP